MVYKGLHWIIYTVSGKQIKFFLLFFYIFQTLYSWLTEAAVFFENGYSTMSFVGLYVLARYVRTSKEKIFNYSAKIDFIIYAIISLFISLCAFLPYVTVLCLNIGNYKIISLVDIISNRIFLYNNPLVIVSSLYLLLGFSKLKFVNNFINWVGASSFAVFLFHTNPNLCDTFFKPIIQLIYNRTGYGVESLIFIFAFLILIYISYVHLYFNYEV